MRTNAVFVAITLSAGVASSARAALIWNESVNGDLSGDRFNPTALVLSVGSNTLTATSVQGDREYVRLTLPAGGSITAIDHLSWQSTDNVGFIAVQAGGTFTEPPTGLTVGNILGYTHFGSATVASDILPGMGAAAGAMGFTPPLTGPVFTFWIQQTSPAGALYTLDFIVTPAPGAAMTGLLAAAVFGGRRRR